MRFIEARWWPAIAALLAVGVWFLYALASASLTLAEGLARGLLVAVIVGVAARESQRWRRRVLSDWNNRQTGVTEDRLRR